MNANPLYLIIDRMGFNCSHQNTSNAIPMSLDFNEHVSDSIAIQGCSTNDTIAIKANDGVGIGRYVDYSLRRIRRD
jgi:hypothetical protein